MRRIVVVGPSGAGKTAFAERLAGRLEVGHVELDAIHHQPGWTQLPEEEFRRRVAIALDPEAWVVDGNYSKVRDVVWDRADTVIILDYPRWLVMARLVPRTLGRIITRKELWQGNRERWRNLFSRIPEDNILLWSWTTHGKLRERHSRAMEDPAYRHLQFLRLGRPGEARRLLEARKVGS